MSFLYGYGTYLRDVNYSKPYFALKSHEGLCLAQLINTFTTTCSPSSLNNEFLEFIAVILLLVMLKCETKIQ